ncbi:hypothetical protein GCM10009133_04500 [Cocleimonas flava]|uniref:Proprotein convertase P-domain-containing protein n=1 Tax=Cocleimonas flava TaxID=634765 RepID=A0A4R1F0P4_9GAMM|nr:proprotein convertase P-domain-containing protein [Cocleimonas flava]TCJ86820.1 proprotein convertase P-domain-containing protein [Cocleimonas flava]
MKFSTKFFTKHSSRTLIACLSISLFTPLYAMDKDLIYSELASKADQIDSARANNDQPSLNSLLSDYQALSDSLGGDDPFGNAVNSQAPIINSAAKAPAPLPNSANNSTTVTETPAAAILNNTNTQVTTTVNTTDSYILDVDLNLDITHTFNADLDITLTSPAGTVIVISTDNGSSNDNVFSGTLFDDDAIDTSPANNVTDFTYTHLVTATPLVPEGALAAFIGENPNGTWTLDVFDDAGGDTGTINSWDLTITTLPVAPIVTVIPTVTSSPALAITDNATVMDTLTIASDGYVCKVNLDVNITHTFNADLDIFLTSPTGSRVTVSTDNGSIFSDVFAGTTFSDDATNGPVTDYVFVDTVTATPLVPEGAFGAFIGESPLGDWILEISDDATFDTGTLNSWGLSFETCETIPVPTDIPSLNQIGLIALLSLLLLFGMALQRKRIY